MAHSSEHSTRRAFLTAGATGAALLAGCLGGAASDDGTTRLAFGEPHALGDWEVAVAGIEFGDSFRDTRTGDRYEMPPNEKLAFADVEFRNASERPRALPAVAFAALQGNRTYRPQDGFDHPQFDDPVRMDWLAKADEHPRFGTDDGTHDPGVAVVRWLGFVVPTSVTQATIEIGVREANGDGYPVRWTPR